MDGRNWRRWGDVSMPTPILGWDGAKWAMHVQEWVERDRQAELGFWLEREGNGPGRFWKVFLMFKMKIEFKFETGLG
jgi:hypothetical protein